MSDATAPQPGQPSTKPPEDRTLTEPATHERCAQDYAQAADLRAAIDRQIHADLAR